MQFSEMLENTLYSSFQTNMLEAMIKCLFSSYRTSFDYCTKTFSKEESHDLLPFYRWVQLRTELRGLGGRFKEITTTSEPNGSSYHIVIDSDMVMLTVSSVDHPSAMPRSASYRTTYANKFQLNIFDPPDDDAKVYAVLTHGFKRDKWDDRRIPAFARIIFPSENCESYLHHVDLFEKFNPLITALTTQNKAVDTKTKEVSPQVTKKIIGE